MEPLSGDERPVNPRQKASTLSRIFFWWIYGVIKKGHEKTYEVEDLPSPLPRDLSQKLGDQLEEAWLKELEYSKIHKKKASLPKAIVKVFWKEFAQTALLHSFNEFVVSISRQVLLGYFLVYLREAKNDPSLYPRLKIIGTLMVLSYGLNSLLTNHFVPKSLDIGNRIKTALSSLIYRKCLRLGNNSEENASVGRILNLMSNDLARFSQIALFCNYAYSGLISTIIIAILICNKVHFIATAVYLILIIFITPMQLLISHALARFREQMANASDERIRLMDEIITGIQIIKMYAWEKLYEKLLTQKRKIEMKMIKNALYIRGIRLAISSIHSNISIYAIFVVYSLTGGKIVPEVVFVVLGYCSIITKVLCIMFFEFFGEYSQCLVSAKRIQNFMELKEFQKPSTTKINEDEKNSIHFQNVKCCWSLDSDEETLKNITLSIESKKLTTVIGHVGAGKSSLLNAILGELPISRGNLMVNGSLSYYSQIPWIFPDTIRENILFFEKYNPDRYEKVVEACALKHDFDMFTNGDLTLIGERGITLSGGQKARIALARAVYKEADIYLLDDPLSAVDVSVNKQIFQECIINFLKEKIRILVTHQLQFLTQSDHVILMEKGQIKCQGTFHQVLEADSAHMDIFKKSDFSDDGHANQEEQTISPTKTLCKDNGVLMNNTKETELEKEDNTVTNPYALMQFITEGMGVTGIIFTFFLFLISQIFLSCCDLWLAYWTSTENYESNTNTTWHFLSLEMTKTQYFILGYSLILVAVLITVLARNILVPYLGQKCSKELHQRALHSVVHTNFSFFHTNPSGRILNRFSKDIGAVDEVVIAFLLEATVCIVQILGAFIVSATINIMFFIPAVLAFLLLFVVRHHYVKVLVNLRRLESITKSPVFVHVHNTMQGLPIIRANSVTDKLLREFDERQDVYTSAWGLRFFSLVGFAYCAESVCFIYLAAIVIGSCFLNLADSQIGLALAQITVLLNVISWAMILSTDIASEVTSIDRLLQYSGLESEKQPPDDSIPNDWPSKGRIIFHNVSFRYNILSQPAIRNISFVVDPEQKVGIVGRTGAGKTSLMAVLFRLGYVSGSVKIDDVDTSSIRLENLRSKISVIPQDPILFSGTLRRNLDPFGQYSDSVLWDALEEAQLKEVIAKKDDFGLDSLVTSGGNNFSLGERQLICLARAIVRKNKILILDEATANVDQQTDGIIQKTIREKFKFCTVLTIAHRLNTVVDSDKILVMDNGNVVEYDHPYKLLSNQNSYFYKLVSETGEFVAAALTEIAKENFFLPNQQVQMQGKKDQ